jgi:hypothetical protein
MSLRTDFHFIQTLDTFNDNCWENPPYQTQLSGWSQEFPETNERRSLLSAGCSRIKKMLAENCLFSKSVKQSEKKVKKQVNLKYLKSGPHSSKISPARRKGYLNRRLQSSEPLEIKKSFNKKSAFPCFKSRYHRNTSGLEEKKHLRLDEYYDKNFLLVQKSPPTVSGYSIVGMFRG